MSGEQEAGGNDAPGAPGSGSVYGDPPSRQTSAYSSAWSEHENDHADFDAAAAAAAASAATPSSRSTTPPGEPQAGARKLVSLWEQRVEEAGRVASPKPSAAARRVSAAGPPLAAPPVTPGAAAAADGRAAWDRSSSGGGARGGQFGGGGSSGGGSRGPGSVDGAAAGVQQAEPADQTTVESSNTTAAADTTAAKTVPSDKAAAPGPNGFGNEPSSSTSAGADPAPLLQQLLPPAEPAESGPVPQLAPLPAQPLAVAGVPAHVRRASAISFGSLASDTQLQTLGGAGSDGEEEGGSTVASDEGQEGSSSEVAVAADAAAGAQEPAAAGEPREQEEGEQQQQQQQQEQEEEQQQEQVLVESMGELELKELTPLPQPQQQQQQVQQQQPRELQPIGSSSGGAVAPGRASFDGVRTELRRVSSSSPEQEEDSAWGCWSRRRRHFFIVTSAGKPVYSRHGDEAALAGFLAVIQAVVSVVADQGDGVRQISSGPLHIVFLVRGHLYLVAASTRAEPVAALRQQLHMLHQHLLLLVTGGIERALDRNPGYDVRQLLSGSQGSLTALLSSTGDAPFWMMGVLEPAPLGAAERRSASAALAEAVQGGGALFGLISAGRQVVALDHGRGQQLSVLDVQLMLNFLSSNDALRVGETFVPVCLPGFNSSAFMHAYVACLDEAGGVYLALMAGSGDAFHRLAARRAPLEEALQRVGLLRKLAEARESRSGGRLPLEVIPPAAGGGVPGTAPLWHFAAAYPARRQGVQAAHAAHVFPDRRSVKELVRAYVRAYCTTHAARLQAGAAVGGSSSGGGPAAAAAAAVPGLAAAASAAAYMLPSAGGAPRPARMLWVASPRWVLLATCDRDLELMCCFDPLVPQEAAVRHAEALRRWLIDRARIETLLLPGAV